MAQTDAEMNQVLNGATLVRELSFTVDPNDGEGTLVLRLAEHAGSRVLELRAGGVTGWRLREFGGGFTQLCCLRVRSVRELQHDRIAFELEDLEHDRLFLRCRTLEVRS